jgi:hypothetical protein
MCFPTVVLAPTSGLKSGWRTVSTGVGTATTMISAAARSAGSVVTVSRVAARSSSLETSHRIDVAAVALHFLGAEVESDGPQLLAECHRERQTDVTESDNGNCVHDLVSFCFAMPQFSLKIPTLGAAGIWQLASACALVSQVPRMGLMHIRPLHDIVINVVALPNVRLNRADPQSVCGLMNWMTWIAILVAWPLLGLGVAYLFGGFIRGAEAPDNAGDLMPPVLS